VALGAKYLVMDLLPVETLNPDFDSIILSAFTFLRRSGAPPNRLSPTFNFGGGSGRENLGLLVSTPRLRAMNFMMSAGVNGAWWHASSALMDARANSSLSETSPQNTWSSCTARCRPVSRRNMSMRTANQADEG
jgi:hypothetical protein